MQTTHKPWLALFGLVGTAHLAACGDSQQMADANTGNTDAMVDAAGDASSLDAALPIVEVTVFDNLAPLENARVIFAAADDTVVAVQRTDASGKASAALPAGGTVTAIYQAFQNTGGPALRVDSIVGVAGGDKLQFGPTPRTAQFTDQAIMVPPLAGATFYTVRTRCGQNGGGTPPTTLSLRTNCGTTPFYVTTNTTPVQTLYLAAQAAPVATPISLLGESYKPPVNQLLTFTNTPNDVTSLQATAYRAVDDLELLPGGGASAQPNPASTSLTVALPDAATPDLRVLLQAQRSNGAYQVISNRAAAGTYSLDVTANTLPWINTLPTFDIAQSRFTWTETAGAKPAAATFARFSVYRDTSSFERRIVAAPTAGVLRVPQLQGADATYNVGATDRVVGSQVDLLDVPGGLPALRANAMAVDDLLTAPVRHTATLSHQPVGGVR